jgi:hypothetical protein
MAASNGISRQMITFDPNVTYELVLKYQVGKQISNGNIMFSTTTDEVFFLKPDDARKIHELGLGINEPFKLVKRVVGSGRNAETTLIVSRVNGQQPGQHLPSTPPAAATVQTKPRTSPEVVAQPSQAKDNSLSRIMASSYIAAIDALLLAEQYAQSKGVPFRLSMGEVRSAAHCIFISASKGVSWQR